MIFDRTMQKFKLGTPPKIKKLMGVIKRTFFSIHRGSPLTNCSFYARDTYRLSRAGLGIIKIVSATDMKGIMQKRISSIEIGRCLLIIALYILGTTLLEQHKKGVVKIAFSLIN